MKKSLIVLFCVLSICGVARFTAAAPETTSEDAFIRQTLEELKQVYSAEIIMGTPLEVNGLKLIPLATVGVGISQHEMESTDTKMQGAGGLLHPVGIIVVSGKDVKLLQFSKSFMAEVVEILIPIALQALNMPASETPNAPAENVTALTMKKSTGFGAKFSSWYYRTLTFFLAGWLLFALMFETFWPQHVTTITSTLQQNYLRAGFVGLAGYGVVLLCAIVFAITLIGLPLSFIIMLLTGLFTLFGSIGVALLTGQYLSSTFGKTGYSNATAMLIGGLMLGIIGFVPILGWLVWAIIKTLGFGAVLQIQWKKVKGNS